MNIHPIFVHFPIAFLTIYALSEIFTIKSLKTNIVWWNIKAFVLFVGFLGTVLAVSTGEMAEELFGEGPSSMHILVEKHAFFAVATQWVFGLLAISYLLKILGDRNKIPFIDKKIVSFIFLVSKKVLVFAIPISIVGLILVTITGSLGGAIVYGPEVDPIVSFFYKIIIGE